ncbi:TetR/AcrR family transcriptional regulator [Amycolatopsis sp. K13G38]|uniref:TetR/AcrR family transcriptional regulator n=1 Tax=Amycolatopsis acididurans TaxID=2724524 RepID=A0ABX1J3X5_9PSEU|nr:TetR/AcrR family transcriptional regulator [Amycolatopsis acididurans]NKQ54486.1 TetR/AcrR family transcriptional regulator [Amycolatopsis acididurans]
MARDNQKRRTRKALVEAAGRLMAEGRRPSVAEVADAAEISRRTAYRYFPSAEQLSVEAALEATRQNMELTIEAGPADAPVADRVDRLVDALSRMTMDNEPLLRQMIRFTIDRDAIEPGVPPRPSRRLEYVERALSPLQGALDQDELDRLAHALAVVIGIESTIVLRDICGLDAEGILRVQHWAARALVATASREARAD